MFGLLILFAIAYAIVVVAGTGCLVFHLLYPARRTLAKALARGDATDPVELGMVAEEKVWKLTGGVESPGWVIEGKLPGGAVIVLVHGHRNSRYGVLGRAARLVAYASRVVVFDLPGHGDAVGKRCTFGVHEPDDVAALIEQLGVAKGERVVLIGSSLGASIAIATAARHPSIIAGVIAEGPFRFWHEPVRQTMWCRGYPAWPFVMLAGWVLRVMGLHLNAYNFAELAGDMRCPLLVLHGAIDPVCSIDSGRAIAEAAEQGELVVFEQGLHEDLAAVDEPLYRATVERFLAPKAPEISHA